MLAGSLNAFHLDGILNHIDGNTNHLDGILNRIESVLAENDENLTRKHPHTLILD